MMACLRKKYYTLETDRGCDFNSILIKPGMKGEDIDPMMGWLTPTMRLLYTKTTLQQKVERSKKIFNLYDYNKKNSSDKN